jgi:hypothetical protein
MGDGTANLRPGPGFALFQRAEALHMTVTKLLTGQDMPLSNIEMALNDTYHRVKHRLEKRRNKG